jgi:mRNA interferase RelE/StbE
MGDARSMSFSLRFTPKVAKQILGLDTKTALRIRGFLEALNLTNPRERGRVLKGDERLWRYRVGEYRLLADIDDQESIVLIVALGHRSQVYR